MFKTGFEKFMVFAIVAALFLFGFSVANAIMSLNTYYDANATTEKVVVHLMAKDPNLTVKVVAYSVSWEKNDVDSITGRAMKHAKALVNTFGTSRVSVLFANKEGLKGDVMPTPAKNGVYFFLD